MKRTVFNAQDSGKFFLCAVLAPQILTLIAEVILVLIAKIAGTTTDALFQISPIFITYIMLAQISFVFVILICAKGVNFKEAFHFEWKMPWQNFLICAIMGIVAVFALSPIVTLFDELLALIGFSATGVGFEINSVGRIILGIVLLALVPAVLEELIFRGGILRGFQKYGKWVAIFSTSALFALVHCNPQQLIFPFVVSIFMCLAVLKTDNILSSITIHFFANATSVLLSYFDLVMMEGCSIFAIIGVSILLMILGLAILWLLVKLLKEKPAKEVDVEKVLDKLDNNLVERKQESNSLLMIGIILAVALFVATTIAGFVL